MSAPCPSCGILDQPAGARFCFACGTVLAAPACSSCGTTLVAGARFCSSCGSEQATPAAVVPPAAPARPVAARRVTSVLFADLVGFTTLSESRDTEDVRELLSRYFDDARRIIERYGGTVEKFIGDAVMAVWGVPTAHEDDAERAVRAGLELVGSVGELGAAVGVPELSMRVGIVTGEVAVTVGAQGQGMVAGDAVNTASRVQSAAAPGHVWVDETTRLLTSSAITFADAGSHLLKGKAEPLPLWAVRAVVAGVRGAQRADGLEAPLAGRDRETRVVKELFHGVEESHRPALLVVGGEAGVGKTRLGWELEKYIDGLSRPVRWHGGRCLAYGEGVAFYALADALRARLQLNLDDEEVDTADRLATGLARWVPDAEERAWLAPRLGALLGIGAVGAHAREDLFSAWTTFLHRVSEDEHPVVLLIDDAHHADEGLVAFVEHLLATAEFGCFVVLLGRPGLLDAFPALAANRRASVLHLEPLPDGEMARLLDGLVSGLPDPVRGSLVERAEGLPLFAVETVRSLIDRDLVVPRGGQYVLADPHGIDLSAVGAPASLQALVAARLDTLTAQQRAVIDRASVLGQSFGRDDIGRLCAEIDDLDQVLGELVRLQVLQREASRFSAELGQFQFLQSVVRQVAYASLSRRERRALHVAVAADLAARDDDGGELAAIVAQHYEDALDAVPDAADDSGLVEATLVHLRRAAARAAALGAPLEAAAHLRRALARSQDPLQTAAIEAELGEALRDAGEYDEAIGHLTRALDACVLAGDRHGAGSAAATLGRCLIGTQHPREALDVTQPWYEELSTDPAAVPIALALADAVAGARMRMSMDIREVSERRVRLAEALDDDAAIAESHNALALHYATTGAVGLALVLLESAVTRARAAHSPRILVRLLTNVNSLLNSVDLARATALGRESTELTRKLGALFLSSVARANLMLALWGSGEWDQVCELCVEESFEESEWRMAAVVRQHIAGARGEDWDRPIAGDVPIGDDQSRDWEDVGEAVRSAGRGEPGAVDRAVAAVAHYYAGSGAYDDFVFLWQLAVELARGQGDEGALAELARIVDDPTGSRPPVGLRALRASLAAFLAERAGASPDTVEAHLRDALAGFEQWGAAPYAARTRVELGRLLLDRGRADEGAALVAAGDGVLERLGAEGWRAALVR